MSPDAQIIVVFALFLCLLAAGMEIPFAIAFPVIVYLYLQDGFAAFNGLGLVSWGSMNSLHPDGDPAVHPDGGDHAAERAEPAGLSRAGAAGVAHPGRPAANQHRRLRAVRRGQRVEHRDRGGDRSVALPQFAERNYDRKLSAGSLAAGGTLGILLPPSIAMIVYGTFSETSVAKLFMAGVIPGLLLAGVFMVLIAVRAMLNPSLAPRERGATSLASLVRALVDVVPFTILIAGILGSIYTGIATPTEAAAAGCMLGIVICWIWGDLTLARFSAALRRTIETVANILFIVYAAFIFSYAISYAAIGEDITGFIIGLHLDRLEFFLALFVLYTVLGCLVESLGMIVITVPLIYPALQQYGIDPVWFGIILVIFIELGQILPPIGINLFVIQSIWDGTPGEVVLGTVPFHLTMFVLLLALVIWPDLALWLPRQMARG